MTNLERRQSPRKRFENLLYVEVEPGNGGMVLNLSEHGFGFRAVKRVRPKTDVKFAFNLDEKRRVGGNGRIEWSDKEGRVAGVQFTDVSDEFLGEMRNWMANAVEYPMQNAGSSNGRTSSSSVPVAVPAMNGDNFAASESSGLAEASPSTNGRDRAAQPHAAKLVRSITSAHSAVAFPLVPDVPEEPAPSETSNRSGGGGTWASLPPAAGAERKPTPPGPRLAAQTGPDFSAATAYKLDPGEHQEEHPDVEDDLSRDFEVAEESNASSELATQTGELSGRDREDPRVSLEDRTARALNEHAQALLQHFQHEEQRTLAAFREAAARVLRDSERQLFPIRESVQAQMKSLESAVTSAGASVKVLDRYPSLLERAQQQALDRFQTQVQEILHTHVMELRRRSETVFEQFNAQANSAGLLPGRIKTSSGIIVTAVLVMLLIGLFVFRREAANGFIWLGRQMVEPAPASEPAKTNSAPVTKPPVQEAAKPPVQDNKPPVPETTPAEEPNAAPADIVPNPEEVTPKQPASREPAPRLQSVKSLWDQVAKGNVTAMLTLGNMYFTGHGVTRNCYQARRLFAAATRKGSLEGKQRLAELDRSTCPIVAP